VFTIITSQHLATCDRAKICQISISASHIVSILSSYVPDASIPLNNQALDKVRMEILNPAYAQQLEYICINKKFANTA
jgi:hypothetical protein